MSDHKMLLFPSMNCANFGSLRDEVIALDKAGADGYHLDISDGTFFPGWSMGLRDVQAVRRNTSNLVDVHLYVTEPSRIVDQMIDAGADILYVFAESEKVIAHTLYRIKGLGKAAGLCVGWSATPENYRDLYPLVDYVMVNATNSYTGKLLPDIYDRVVRLLDMREKAGLGFRVLMDGGVSSEVIARAWGMGVDGFTMGTNCLFDKSGTYEELFRAIREIEQGSDE